MAPEDKASAGLPSCPYSSGCRKWIQGGREDGVEDSSHAPLHQGVAGAGLHVGRAPSAIKQEHGGQVGRARGEGLPAAGGGVDLKHSGQDADTGRDSEAKAAHDDTAADCKSCRLMGICVGTG